MHNLSIFLIAPLDLNPIMFYLSGNGSKFLVESNDVEKDKLPMKKFIPLEDGHTVLPMVKHNHRSSGDLRIKVLDKQPVIDELDDVVRLKEAEAEIYHKRADDARREAKSLKQICLAKTKLIEEDYTNELIRLQIPEIEKKCKLKVEQLHALEKAHREYITMKEKMEEDAKTLMVQMEDTVQNLGL